MVMDIIALYPKVSVLHKHGSQKGKEMSPVAMKVFDYLLKYKAPSDRSELESLMSLVEEKKGWLKQIGNDYPTLKMKKSTYAYERSPYDLIKKEIDRVIKTNYKDVTDGIIGSYNDAKAKQRKYILIGAVVVVAIVITAIIVVHVVIVHVVVLHVVGVLAVVVRRVDACLTAVEARHRQRVGALATKPWVEERDAVGLVILGVGLGTDGERLAVTLWDKALVA